MRWGTESRLVGFLLVLTGDVPVVMSCLRNAGRAMVILEFSSWTAAAFLAPISYFADLSRVALNINHNLNSRMERWLMRRVLSRRFKLVFIEPAPELVRALPFVQPLPLEVRHGLPRPVRTVYCFLGNRREQWLPDADAYVAQLGTRMDMEGCSFKMVGGPRGTRISAEEMASIFRKDSGAAVVLLYDLAAYSWRHSGIALEAIVLGIPLFMPAGPLGAHYSARGFRVRLFSSPQELATNVTDALKASSREADAPTPKCLAD